jgi:hypothetical protein
MKKGLDAIYLDVKGEDNFTISAGRFLQIDAKYGWEL